VYKIFVVKRAYETF